MVKGAHLWLLATACAGAAAAAAAVVDDFPQNGLENPIKRFVYNNNGLGSYSFEYETSDGTFRQEDGGLDITTGSLVVRGEYGYIGPEGNIQYVRYVADHRGFQPQVPNDDTRFNDRRMVLGLIERSVAVIYTYEDVELRRIFPNEFPQDTVRRSGAIEPEHLGRYAELSHYFNYPKNKLNSHFEELACYDNGKKKTCKIDLNRYSPEEDSYYKSADTESHVDRRRVYCLMLLCFTEDELDRVVASF